MSSSLVETDTGEKIKVANVKGNVEMRRRLMELGIVEGTELEIITKAPMGDPIEIRLRGYNLSIRESDAREIIVQRD